MGSMQVNFSSSRRGLLALSALALAGCGFELRKPPLFAFKTIAVKGNSATVNLLRRNLQATGTLKVIPAEQADTAEAVLDVLGEERSQVVLSTTSAGLVRELDVVLRFRFRLSTPGGKVLLGPTALEQHRALTYNETNALAKAGEIELLYRDMQKDIAEQTVRRLGAVKQA